MNVQLFGTKKCPETRKAERVAMEEVRQGKVHYDVPPQRIGRPEGEP